MQQYIELLVSAKSILGRLNHSFSKGKGQGLANLLLIKYMFIFISYFFLFSVSSFYENNKLESI